jgi:uncharacterized protein YndB with AHSA1/START domain
MTVDTMGELRRDGADRATVRFERVYDATPAEVWAALTEPGQLAGWLAPADFDAREGGAYELRMGTDGNATGSVRIWQLTSVLELTWTWTGEPDSVVRFELEEADGGTRLVLEHTGLRADDVSGYGAGWHSHLELLGRALAGDPAEGTWTAIDSATEPVVDRVRADYEQAAARLG